MVYQDNSSDTTIIPTIDMTNEDSKVGLIPMDKPVNTRVSYNDQHQLAKELASLAVSLEKDVQHAVYTHIHDLIELLKGGYLMSMISRVVQFLNRQSSYLI